MFTAMLRKTAVVFSLVALCLTQALPAFAGTTGRLTGSVTDTNGRPVAGASVKVTSASQIAATTTDSSGHFVFLSLEPDTYTIAIEKNAYEPLSLAGITIFADQAETLPFTLRPQLKEITRVTSTSAGSLVRSGTTSDVYSVNAGTAAKVTGLGGGGGLDNAYSAIATVPGAYVPVGQSGWYQTVYIRGGDYDQVGYEVDGVPVNRSFDNYPSNTASSLGQQEVQVYTGASPADSQGQGLAGYINQVIKTGTYPGFGTSDAGVGAPAFYHKLNVEAGGASPDRLFSYYVGLGGYTFDQREYDQFDGNSISSTYGPVFTTCPTLPTPSLPSCYSGGSVNGTYMTGSPCIVAGCVQTPGLVLAPYYTNSGNIGNNVVDRDSVVNFHFGIPHHHDSGRDDIQLLYETSQINQYYANSPSDFAPLLNNPALGLGTPTFISGNLYTGPLNVAVNPATVSNQVSNYAFPYSNGLTAIPPGQNDSSTVGDAIIKVQYQKNFSSDAYLRVYGYTDYSNWFNNGPNSMAYTFGLGLDEFDQLPQYYVSSHTRGGSAVFADQLSSKNLLQVQFSYTTANSQRANYYTSFDSPGEQFATLVSSAAPDSGICYTPAGTPTGCSTANYAPGNVTLGAVAQNGAAAFAPLPASCNGAPCEYLAEENGENGEYNDVTPKFASGSIVDTFDPNDKLHINAGVRYDNYTFIPSNTQATGARQFWFNAWNDSMCYNTATPSVLPVALGTVTPTSNASTGACSSLGSTYVQAYLSNVDTPASFTIFQPRFGATYRLNRYNVLRFSYGRYDQAPTTAYEEYDTFQQDLPDYLGPTFFGYGRTSPTYPIAPEISNNYDISLEHQIPGTDLSFKITPFYRKTQDQIENFYLNVTAGFVSGLNIGSQTNEGVEFELQKGDFAKDGFSGLLSFTYTNAYVNYSNLSNGTSVLSNINQNIQQFNAYTSACANKTAAASLCGTPIEGAGTVGACYTPATPASAGPPATPAVPGTGTAAGACGPGLIANPYWNMAPQALLPLNANYAPYDLFPAGPAAGSYGSFVTPYTATAVLNYKHGRYSITPAVQFSAGNRYGYPLSSVGYDPATCSQTTAVPVGMAYYGSAGGYGNAANTATCTGTLDIPNLATAHFDNIGAFVQPSRLTLTTQLTYEISPKITAVLTLANLVDTCFGGTSAAWTTGVVGIASKNICAYGSADTTSYGYAPGNLSQISATGKQIASPETASAYVPAQLTLPFNAFLDFRIRL